MYTYATREEDRQRDTPSKQRRTTRTDARRLAADDGELHVLDLYPHQEEVDLAQHHVPQVVPGLCVCVC